MKRERTITGAMVLAGTLAFFAVVFAANGALVFFALDTFPGMVTERPYEAGLAYNRELEAAARQETRGWIGDLTLDAAAGRVTVRIVGSDKAPIGGLEARVSFRRPLGQTLAQTVRLAEQALGTYVAQARLPVAGRWYGTVEAKSGGQPVFRMERELMVKR